MMDPAAQRTVEAGPPTGPSPGWAKARWLAVAGALLFAGGVIAFLGIITAEALYPPGYSTSQNEISDLGATDPPNSVITQPSATIFDTTMMVCGVLMLAGSFCLQRGFRRWTPPILMALFGLGVLGVGIFPGNHGNVHALFALLTFIAGGMAAIVAWTVEQPPFRYFSVALGLIALVTLILYWVLGESSPLAGLGIGGVERWVAYPILLWVTGLGGHLMGRAHRG
jgi:hypothetical membrane protein